MKGDSYEDIIHLPHHVSKKHPPMPLRNRAAQFMPFAALTGYEAEIEESARLTEEARDLSEDSEAALNVRIQSVQAALQSQKQPEVSVTYFRPDEKKPGGAYIIKKGAVKKIDSYTGRILFSDGTEIPLCGIVEIALRSI
ncbi:MAG: hypothetical protein IJT43_10655 [Stomatobaculum sp.]|nr:hypothetical protein [Stomatobaculum sp.]